MICNIGGEEGQALLAVFVVLIPASFYIMGLVGGRKGLYLFSLGVLTHLFSMIQRGMVVGSIPLTEKHDNISFMAFSMALTYLYFHKKKKMADLGVTALPLISLSLLVSLAYEPVNTMSPFLRTPWFYLHIFLYFVSYGFFGISACIGLFYLIKGEAEQEVNQYRAAIHGWIMLSLSLVIGSIWFFVSYGTYWLWTSKELWTTLTWIYYGLYLHARLMKGLRGRPAAALGCLGFAIALFTYFGVGTIIPSPPTQF
ncbi:MAG: cytochrome c biogenesis protein CcsA [Nitrospirae bacterium]|nr:cytochrome c biogenesis protein CcsA [Nitrospirota bacterium]